MPLSPNGSWMRVGELWKSEFAQTSDEDLDFAQVFSICGSDILEAVNAFQINYKCNYFNVGAVQCSDITRFFIFADAATINKQCFTLYFSGTDPDTTAKNMAPCRYQSDVTLKCRISSMRRKHIDAVESHFNEVRWWMQLVILDSFLAFARMHG